MKGFAMLGIGKTGWIEKERPVCGPMDAIVKPIAVSPCTSDVHTVWEGAIGDRHDMILGHEAVGEVVEVGAMVRDFHPGDRVRAGQTLLDILHPLEGEVIARAVSPADGRVFFAHHAPLVKERGVVYKIITE